MPSLHDLDRPSHWAMVYYLRDFTSCMQHYFLIDCTLSMKHRQAYMRTGCVRVCSCLQNLQNVGMIMPHDSKSMKYLLATCLLMKKGARVFLAILCH